jgi:hypothetical protein
MNNQPTSFNKSNNQPSNDPRPAEILILTSRDIRDHRCDGNNLNLDAILAQAIQRVLLCTVENLGF